MVITVRKIVAACDTYDQGTVLRGVLLSHIQEHGSVVVSFEGVSNATTSFVNAAFVEMLRHMSFDDFKRRVQITRAHRQVAGMIKERMLFESNRRAFAA